MQSLYTNTYVGVVIIACFITVIVMSVILFIIFFLIFTCITVKIQLSIVIERIFEVQCVAAIFQADLKIQRIIDSPTEFSSWRDVGADERFSDCVRGCGRLLSSQWCNRVCRQRRERTSLNSATRSDYAAKCPRHQGPLGDSLRTRIHLKLHAGAYSTLPFLSVFRENIKCLCLYVDLYNKL